MRVAATALFATGLGLFLAAAGLVVQPYAGLPRSFAVPLVVVGMVAWAVAGGVLLAHSGSTQREGDHRQR